MPPGLYHINPPCVNTYMHVYTLSAGLLFYPCTTNPFYAYGGKIMAEKKANYTAAQTDELTTAYAGSESDEDRAEVVEEFAARFGKSAQSIRAKLVSEGVYIAKAYKTKKGEKPESKALIVANIANLLGVDAERVESLEKANKTALNLVRGTLAAAHKMLREES